MIAVQRGTYTDRSGSTTSNTSVQVMAADTTKARAGWFFQNQSDSNMYINFTSDAAATGNSILVGAGESISSVTFPTTEKISVWCGSSSKKFCAKEFYQE